MPTGCLPARWSLNPIYSSPGSTGLGYTSWPKQHRNMYRGPGFFDSDFTVNNNFKLTEWVAFGFAGNFYNVFNHPNFTNPDPNLANGTFWQITSTDRIRRRALRSFATGLPSGRIIQFQGKIVF